MRSGGRIETGAVLPLPPDRIKRLKIRRIFIPASAIEQSTGLPLASAAPLLEEKRDTLILAGESQLFDPFQRYRACARATFAADDRPMVALQVDHINRAEKWLE